MPWRCELLALVLGLTEMEHAKTITVKFVECTIVFWYMFVVTDFLK